MRPEASFAALLCALAALATPRRAEAFPWMIHHGYTGCAQCHVDPSGSGVLTAYGRAQSEILLRTHYGDARGNPDLTSQFLFGRVPIPSSVQIQPDLRALLIPEPGNMRFILMQADLRAGLQLGRFSASASLGGVSAGAEQAWVLGSDTGMSLVSREYWVAIQPTRSWELRVGRMNLPYGLRTEDHILYVRSATATSINDDQQVGASAVYQTKKVRAELMGIAGNFQVSPDDFRKRGYSGYAALALSKTFEVGASSLWTTSKLDTDTLAPRTFAAEGLFLRAAPIKPLAILAEADLMVDRQDSTTYDGLVGNAVVDYEPVQGLHVQGIGGYCDSDLSSPDAPAWTGRVGVQWFFAPRVDVRIDGGDGVLYCTQGQTPTPFGLIQAHFFL